MGWVDARIGQGNDRYQGMAFGWIFVVLIGVIHRPRVFLDT